MADDNQDTTTQPAEEETLETPVAGPAGSTLPLVITLAALLIYFGFQAFQLLIERGNLGAVKNNQAAALREAQKIQTQFKLLLTKTNELADQGHAGAKMVMEGLQRQGMAGSPAMSKPPAAPETKAAK